MPNVEVRNNGSNNDDLSNHGAVDNETSIPVPQGHVTLVVDAVEVTETPIVHEMVEPESRMEEAAPTEVVPMIADTVTATENRIIVHEYPNAGNAFTPPFGEILPYHRFLGGFSVPIGYASMYKKPWKM